MAATHAIFFRELVAASRRKSLFAARTIYLAAALGLILAMWLPHAGSWRLHPGLGSDIFTIFAWVQCGLMAALAVAFGSDLIAGERRRNTLDLLLVAGQSSLDIVWNKFLSHMVFLEMLLASSLAGASLIVWFGGVTWLQVLVLFIVLSTVAAQWFAFAVFLSALVRDGRSAGLLACGALAIAFWDAALSAGRPWMPMVPRQSMSLLLTDVWPWLYPPDVTAAAVLTGLWLAAAAAAMRMGQAPELTPLERLKRLFFASAFGRSRKPRHPSPVGTLPLVWRERRSGLLRPGGMAGRIGFLALLVLEAVAVCLLVRARKADPLLFLASLLSAAMLVFTAVLAAGSVTSEKERGTLDLLLTTPLDAQEIVLSKELAILGRVWPLAVLAAAAFLAAFYVLDRLVMLPVLLALLAAATLLVVAIGVSMSVDDRSPRFTSSGAVAVVVALALAVGGLLWGVYDHPITFCSLLGALSAYSLVSGRACHATAVSSVRKLRIERIDAHPPFPYRMSPMAQRPCEPAKPGAWAPPWADAGPTQPGAGRTGRGA